MVWILVFVTMHAGSHPGITPFSHMFQNKAECVAAGNAIMSDMNNLTGSSDWINHKPDPARARCISVLPSPQNKR